MSATMDMRDRAYALAETGSVDLYAWVNDTSGDVVDIWLTNPGEVCADNGHSEGLQALHGEGITFAGKLSAAKLIELQGVK